MTEINPYKVTASIEALGSSKTIRLMMSSAMSREPRATLITFCVSMSPSAALKLASCLESIVQDMERGQAPEVTVDFNLDT